MPVDAQCRPAEDVAAQLEFLIKSREFVQRYGLPSSVGGADNPTTVG